MFLHLVVLSTKEVSFALWIVEFHDLRAGSMQPTVALLAFEVDTVDFETDFTLVGLILFMETVCHFDVVEKCDARFVCLAIA
jgi:hypothetical protein